MSSSTQHFPPPLGKGEGNLDAHALRQRGRVGARSHSQGFRKPAAELAGRWAQTPSGVNPKRAKIPPGCGARAPALGDLGALSLARG